MSVVESEPIRTRLDSAYVSTIYDVDFVIELNTNDDKSYDVSSVNGDVYKSDYYTI